MADPHIVTPEVARRILDALSEWTHGGTSGIDRVLLNTVATEPERIAAAVEEERNRWRKMTQTQIDTERGFW